MKTTWTASAGTLGSATSVTNANGDATNTFALGRVFGNQTVTATVTGAVAAATWTAVVSVTSLTFPVAAVSIGIGDTVAIAPTGRDQLGNTITGGTVTLFFPRNNAIVATPATGTAIGPYVYSAVLAAGGFLATTEGHTVTQPESAQTALLIGFTVVPALLMAAALTFQLRWTLDAARVAVPGR